MCELGHCVKFTRVEICRPFYIIIPLMNKVGFLIQVKSFGSELRKQTLWKRNDENTDWHWILEYKPSAVFTHSQTARSNIREIVVGCSAYSCKEAAAVTVFCCSTINNTATPRLLRVLFRLGKTTLCSRVADQPDGLVKMWKLQYDQSRVIRLWPRSERELNCMYIKVSSWNFRKIFGAIS